MQKLHDVIVFLNTRADQKKVTGTCHNIYYIYMATSKAIVYCFDISTDLTLQHVKAKLLQTLHSVCRCVGVVL